MKQLYIHGGKAYLILRSVLESHFHGKGNQPQLEYVQTYRDWVGADHVLRNQTHYMFCETIEDVEFEMIKDDIIIETKKHKIQKDIPSTPLGRKTQRRKGKKSPRKKS